MVKIILVTGGARSGKSEFAENYAKSFGEKVLYIATSIPFDDEMKDRVEKHKKRRPASWKTLEQYKSFTPISTYYDSVLLDCATIMSTNIMFEFKQDWEDSLQKDIDEIEEIIINEFENLLNSFENIIIVTNEVGFGIVPDNKTSRIFRDIAGNVNKYIASVSDEVYLTVCGIATKIKG